MKNYPQQLCPDVGREFCSVFANPVDTYINFSGNRLAPLGQGEGDYIRVVIMLQELAVNLQQPLIGNEDIVQLSKLFPFLFEKREQG